jgi:small subunit ribosomal protein S16
MNGAQPTDTVRAMLSYRGILLRKHLQIGVIKGALTQEEADRKLAEWKQAKDAKIQGRKDKLKEDKLARAKARKAAESKIKDARAEAIRKKAQVAEQGNAAQTEPEGGTTPAETETENRG